jgi:hypothetical protein
LQGNGISSDIAPAIAEKFVSKLQKINGSRPESLQKYTDAWDKVDELLSGKRLEEWIGVGCELSCRDQCVGVLLEDIKEYVLFAWKYMQVRIEPIEMRIEGKVVEYIVPECEDSKHKYDMLLHGSIFRVSSPYYIEDLSPYRTPNLPRRLKNKFKSLILKERQQFTECLEYTAHKKYIEKAHNMLVHKMFEKSGLPIPNHIDDPYLEKIRTSILKYVRMDDLPIDVKPIYDALKNIISFLSTTDINL